MEINVTDRYTEISMGGGKYLTQSSKTMFPEFWTRKILAPGETADDFREVTAAEREKLEAARAAWVRPSQELIDHFTYLANRYVTDYGGFNEATGYFELGTVKDLTTQDAIKMLSSLGAVWASLGGSPQAHPDGMFFGLPIRAMFPLAGVYGAMGGTHFGRMFQDCAEIEEVFITGQQKNSSLYVATGMHSTFYGCISLRKITFARWNNPPVKSFTDTFHNCQALEDLLPPFFWGDVSFKYSPKLSTASLGNIIARATPPDGDTKGITVTLHSTAYAKLSEEQLAAAAEKNITFTTP